MLSVVIPCLDEAGNLDRLESELFPLLDEPRRPYEIVAVDDGSTDATPTLLAELASRRPELRIVTHPGNLGLGSALRSGIRAARGDWLVALDADLSFHPRHIRELLELQRRSQADCVTGSPFLEHGTRGLPWRRRVASWAANALYRGLFDRRLTSYTPIFRLYRSSALRALPLHSRGFEISAEILVRLLRGGFKAVEAPVPLTERRSGSSKLRPFREIKNHLALIASLLRER